MTTLKQVLEVTERMLSKNDNSKGSQNYYPVGVNSNRISKINKGTKGKKEIHPLHLKRLK